jgi:large subunit ribosomal protein L41
MFHPTPSLAGNLRRLALTTKNGPKDYYKGTRSGAMGRHTRRGRYIVMFEKVRTYVYPLNMEACNVPISLLLVHNWMLIG